MDKVVIRSLDTKDAEGIKQIYSKITRSLIKTDFTQIIKQHANREEDACLVAVLDGKIIGFMVSYILTMGFGINKSAWIATLGVDPQYMGQGIGRKLAHEILKYYKKEGITTVYTSVRWDSSDLLSFFKTLGFDRSNFINLRKNID